MRHITADTLSRLRFKTYGKLPVWEGLALFSCMGMFGPTSLITCPDQILFIFKSQIMPQNPILGVFGMIFLPVTSLSTCPCHSGLCIWVLVCPVNVESCPKMLQGSSCSQHLGLCRAPLVSKSPFGVVEHDLKHEPSFEVCRGYRDQTTFPAEALETVLASCSRYNLTYPNCNVILWWGGSLCHLSLQAPIRGIKTSATSRKTMSSKQAALAEGG